MSVRLLAALGIVVLAVGLAVLILLTRDRTAGSSMSGPDNATAAAPKDADVSASGVELVQGGEGRALWRLKAARADYNQDRNRVDLSSPNLTYYLDEQGKSLNVEARTGLVDREQGFVKMRGDVRGRYGDMAFSAQALDYAEAAKHMDLTGDVSMSRPGMDLTALAVDLNLETRLLTATGNVTAVILESAIHSQDSGAAEQ